MNDGKEIKTKGGVKLVLSAKRGRRRGIGRLVVTDERNSTAVFESVKELADFFNVTRPAVYAALARGVRLRGCLVESERP